MKTGEILVDHLFNPDGTSGRHHRRGSVKPAGNQANSRLFCRCSNSHRDSQSAGHYNCYYVVLDRNQLHILPITYEHDDRLALTTYQTRCKSLSTHRSYHADEIT